MSIANSSTDPTAAVVTIGVTFNPSAAGLANLAIESSIEDSAGLDSGVATVGHFTVQGASPTLTVQAQPTASFTVDGTQYTGSYTFTPQPGGDTLAVAQSQGSQSIAYHVTASDGSISEVSVAPRAQPIGGSDCPWTCGQGSCQAPIPPPQPGPAPIISANGISGHLQAGGTSTITISGSNFGSTAGALGFCGGGVTPLPGDPAGRDSDVVHHQFLDGQRAD